MIRKVYTHHDTFGLTDENCVFTSEQRSKISESLFKTMYDYSDQYNLIRSWRDKHKYKLSSVLPYMKEYRDHHHSLNSCLSLGCSIPVLEHFISDWFTRMECSDFDEHSVTIGRALFSSSIDMKKFDFLKDNIMDIHRNYYDMCLLIASSYVLDDEQFISFFKKLREVTGSVHDFHANVIPLKKKLNYLLTDPVVNVKRRLFGRRSPQGQMHGYSRCHEHLCKLYKKSGWHVVNVTRSGIYDVYELSLIKK